MKKLIVNISIILLVFIILFLSQKPYFDNIGNIVYSKFEEIKGFFDREVTSRVSGELEKRKEIAAEELEEQKSQVTDQIGSYIGNIFKGIKDSIISSVKE